MDPFQTPGAFSWCELTTPDPARAAEFYGALFGWTFDTMEMGGGPYRVIRIGEAALGGLMAMPPGAPAMPPSWAPYVTVKDCDQTVAQCQSLGGRLLVGPIDIPSVGRFAVIQDPQGAALNVIAYANPG